jgi:hypothetical protein
LLECLDRQWRLLAEVNLDDVAHQLNPHDRRSISTLNISQRRQIAHSESVGNRLCAPDVAESFGVRGRASTCRAAI